MLPLARRGQQLGRGRPRPVLCRGPAQRHQARPGPGPAGRWRRRRDERRRIAHPGRRPARVRQGRPHRVTPLPRRRGRRRAVAGARPAQAGRAGCGRQGRRLAWKTGRGQARQDGRPHPARAVKASRQPAQGGPGPLRAAGQDGPGGGGRPAQGQGAQEGHRPRRDLAPGGGVAAPAGAGGGGRQGAAILIPTTPAQPARRRPHRPGRRPPPHQEQAVRSGAHQGRRRPRPARRQRAQAAVPAQVPHAARAVPRQQGRARPQKGGQGRAGAGAATADPGGDGDERGQGG